MRRIPPLRTALAAALAALAAGVPGAASAQIFGLEGVPPDLAALARSCDAGERADCRRIVRRYADGEGLPGRPEIARQLLEQICSGLEHTGHSEGYAAFRSAVRRARPCWRTFAGWLRRRCDAGDGSDCARLASLHEHGIGVARDEARAAALLEPVCADAEDRVARGGACLQLGGLLERGVGVPRDPGRALALYERACEAIPRSCERLGALHEEGALGPRDREAAGRAYGRACEAGVPHACGALQALEAAAPPTSP